MGETEDKVALASKSLYHIDLHPVFTTQEAAKEYLAGLGWNRFGITELEVSG
jgi:hypothetical protein